MEKQIRDWEARLGEVTAGCRGVVDLIYLDGEPADISDLKTLIAEVETAALQTGKEVALLELLATFDDYSHPIQMDAEYVRKQIHRFVDKLRNEQT
jgi:hypothetical protein